MSQQALLTRIVRALEAAGVEYMLTGSFASSLQGEPRSTHDVDLVIAVEPPQVPALVRALSLPGSYLDPEAVGEAVRARGMFNLVDGKTGDKADFWVLTDEPFDQARFSRRQGLDTEDEPLAVSSPEDTILMKLKWAKESGGSEKHLGDALGVYELQSTALDRAYLREWAARLGVEELLDDLIVRAEPL